MSYNITDYTYQKAKENGLEVKQSSLKNKKIDVFKDGKKIASIGAIDYPDYPTYVKTHGLEYANKRRKLFHERFQKKKSLNVQLAKLLLW